MNTVLVTGAGGFIGGAAAREFVDQGWRAIALVHRATPEWLARLAEVKRVRLVRGDITDPDGLEAALAPAVRDAGGRLDAVVHCAGRVSDTGWRSAFRRANFDAVRGLLDLSRRLDAGRFVFVSTTDVYGMRDFRGESEDELPLEPRPVNPYPAFKIAAEEAIRDALPAARYAIVRPAQVWGVGDPTLTPRIVDFLRRSPWIVHFGPWKGANRWPHAHVRNVAATLVLAATRPEAAGRAVNAVDSEWTSLDRFYRLVASVYLPDRTFRSVTCPGWLGRGFGAAVSAVSDLLNLRRPVLDPSAYALRAVSSSLDFGNGRMRELFAAAGRKPVSLEEGLAELREEARRALARQGLPDTMK
jgi:nucleoside-diphosphate-sugar epimerase